MTSAEKKALQLKAVEVREGILTSTHGAKAGHPGGSLSAADMFTYLYFKEMNVDPKNPRWEDRDRFVLSKGHTAPGLYSALALKGFFPVADLPTLRHIDSYLQGHPNMNTVPGIDMSTGSLGQGLSAAAGMAKAAKYIGKDGVRVYSVLGDGELAEGQIWEAFMFAGAKGIDNLTVVIDNNGLQIDGKVEDVCSVYPIDKKLEAFNFNVVCIDGHDFDQIRDAFAQAKAEYMLNVKKYSLATVRARLSALGIDKEVIEGVLLNFDIDNQIDEIVSIITKKYVSKLSTPEKVVAAMLRKGFKYGEIRRALGKIDIDVDIQEY